jgi:hypothetical protein
MKLARAQVVGSLVLAFVVLVFLLVRAWSVLFPK